MNIAFFIPPIILLAYLAYRNTNHGIYLILATIPGYLLRAEFLSIPTTWLELAIYTVATVSLYKHIRKKTLAPHFYYALHDARPYVIPAIVFGGCAIVASAISPSLPRSFGIIKAWFFDPLLFSILLLDKIARETVLKRMIFSLSVSGLPIMLYGIVEYVLGRGLSIPGRLDSFFESPNYVAMYLVPLSLLVAGEFITRGWFRDGKKFQNIYCILWLLGVFVTIALTKSFGGWFGALGGVMFFAAFFKKISAKKLIVFALAFIVLTFAGFYGYQKSKTHYDSFWKINSLETRRELWGHTLTMISETPFIGVSLGGFHDEYAAHIKKLPREQRPVEKDVLWPHNIYLTLWVEGGVVLLAAFLWILLIFYFETFRAYASSGNRLVLGAASAMTSIVLHGFFDTPYLKNDLSLLFWIIIIISVASAQNVMERKNNPTAVRQVGIYKKFEK